MDRVKSIRVFAIIVSVNMERSVSLTDTQVQRGKKEKAQGYRVSQRQNQRSNHMLWNRIPPPPRWNKSLWLLLEKPDI